MRDGEEREKPPKRGNRRLSWKWKTNGQNGSEYCPPPSLLGWPCCPVRIIYRMAVGNSTYSDYSLNHLKISQCLGCHDTLEKPAIWFREGQANWLSHLECPCDLCPASPVPHTCLIQPLAGTLYRWYFLREAFSGPTNFLGMHFQPTSWDFVHPGFIVCDCFMNICLLHRSVDSMELKTI